MRARIFTVVSLAVCISILVLPRLLALAGAAPATNHQGPTSLSNLQQPQQAATTTYNIELIGQIRNATQAVAVEGSYAYVAFWQQLLVVDVSDPGRPALIGVSPALPDDEIRDVDVTGSHVYVAAGEAGTLLRAGLISATSVNRQSL